MNDLMIRWSAVATVAPMYLAAKAKGDQEKLSWVWVFFAVLVMVAAAVAFVWCVRRGYRGFAGKWRFHTKWKIPIGIDLACY